MRKRTEPVRLPERIGVQKMGVSGAVTNAAFFSDPLDLCLTFQQGDQALFFLRKGVGRLDFVGALFAVVGGIVLLKSFELIDIIIPQIISEFFVEFIYRDGNGLLLHRFPLLS